METISLRFLSADITPVNVKLGNIVRTSRKFDIIKRAEKQLLNERIRTINNAIEISSWQRDTCISQLVSALDQDTFEECQTFISRVREASNRHIRERQVEHLTGGGLKNQVAT